LIEFITIFTISARRLFPEIAFDYFESIPKSL